MASVQTYSELPDDWARGISARRYDLAQLYASVDALYRKAGSRGISPRERADVFRAFHLTPLDEVRAVILGEDPYPDPDQAHGLAFSTPVAYGGRRPTSLARIFGALRRDLGILPTQDDLSPWAERGTLLLNVALTHRVGDIEPDLFTWKKFTVEALRVVDAQRKDIAWLLWGDFANDVADLVPIGNPRHRRFENAHPRAGRALRLTLAQSPPFREVSAFLGSNPRADWNV